MSGEQTSDPHFHAQRTQQRLREEIDHLREDVERVQEPQLRAIFETSAEVLGGVVKAIEDYERKNEPAWSPPES